MNLKKNISYNTTFCVTFCLYTSQNIKILRLIFIVQKTNSKQTNLHLLKQMNFDNAQRS